MLNRDTFLYITEKLNSTISTWGIGGSLLLFQHGIIDQVNDLDIIVEKTQVEPIVRKLRSIGQEREVFSRAPFHTTHFYGFNVKDISIDVMGEFKIEHTTGMYVLPFMERSVKYHVINGIEVPFCLLEDWYILYQLMPGREEKAQKIEQYFEENRITNKAFLEESVTGNLPEHVKMRIQSLLASCSYNQIDKQGDVNGL